MTTELLCNGIVKRLTASTGMYLTQSATDIPVQWRIFATSLTMNANVPTDTYREADEAEYQQWLIEYQAYLDSQFGDGPLSKTDDQDI